LSIGGAKVPVVEHQSDVIIGPGVFGNGSARFVKSNKPKKKKQPSKLVY
jgi:hypothetical protein